MADAIKMPDLGSGTEEGTLLNWLKKVGDTITASDVIAEVESDKATIEVPAGVNGTITQLIGQPGETLKVGATIGYVGASGEKPTSDDASAAPLPAAAEPTQQQVNGNGNGNGSAPAEVDGDLPDGVRASPIARRLAAEKGIDIKQIKGSGPNGRIVREDVEKFTPSAAAPAQTAPAPAPAAPASAAIPAPSFGAVPTGDDVEVVEISRLRTTIARRMVESKQQVPHFYVTSQVNVSALLDLRKQINATLDDEHKVSVNDLVIKATALTLRKFPNLNSHYYGDKIIRHKRIHIGIAVALPEGGLMNVVAKDADKVSLSTLAAQNKAMIARARDRKVKPDDVQGSTFTVSNLGAYDVDVFQAIINPPEAGILAVGAAQKIPVVNAAGEIVVENRMKVTISVDHRVSDGAEAAQFLQAFRLLVENPLQLLV